MSDKISVPRKLIELTVSFRLDHANVDELRALLAAPVVERQPFAYSFRFAGCVTAAGPESWRDEIDREKPAQFLFDDCRVKDFQPLFTTPPELAELQAAIVHLKEGMSAHWKVVCDQRTEIERLKGGYKTYITQPAESLAGMAARQLKDENRWIEIRDANALDYPDMRPSDYYPVGSAILIPFTSPPAPVSVVPDDVLREATKAMLSVFLGGPFDHREPCDLELQAARALLDKVKELNP